MKRTANLSVWGAVLPTMMLGGSLAHADGRNTAAAVGFQREIRPILAEYCMACHGPAKQEAGLRFDLAELVVTGQKKGSRHALVPGKPNESELIRRINSNDPDAQMPPPDSGKTLKPESKELLRQWVAEGAKFEKHWSFEPIARPTPAKTEGRAWSTVRNPIDSFLLARMSQNQQGMRAQADRPTLIRRAAFALTGLPPTRAEVEAFLADKAPDAYERVVDQYLASPRYGEEFARHWLDIARYGDTHGLHLDNERQMWAYRNWVIEAFNRNLAFDQFTVQQLAGDLLPPPSAGNDDGRLIATGFLRCNVSTSEGGSIDEEWIFRNAVDRTSTVFGAFLGLTGGCAVCHDHKFDPITAKDYYSMYAFFHSAADPAMDGNVINTAPTMPIRAPDFQRRVAEARARVRQLRQETIQRASTFAYTDPADLPKSSDVAIDDVWFEDDPVAGTTVLASPGRPTKYVTAKDGKVFSGGKAIRRSEKGLAQDVFQPMPARSIPSNGKLFAYVWLDPKNPPKSVMLQYHTDEWRHRAVWGDIDAIEWGAKNSPERVHMGPLPEKNKWVRLEIPSDKLALNPGTQVNGFALTQFGGTVFWDKVGVVGNGNPATDPNRSLRAWWKQQSGKDLADADETVKRIANSGPNAKPAAADLKQLRDHYLAFVCVDSKAKLADQHKRLADESEKLKKLEGEAPVTFIFRDLAKPRDSHIMLRGMYDKRGEKVVPATPAFLPPLATSKNKPRATRLDLANWLVSPGHPLTSRVTVNRFWQQMFGIGLVKSSGDFGMQGEAPSHPELLDWLANWFVEHRWDVKELTRLIVTTNAFRQESAAPAEDWRRDPENRLLARGPRFRLDAEQLRDNALFVGGLLHFKTLERGALPYQPSNIWEPVGFVGSNTRFYAQDKGDRLYSRSIYVFIKRTAPAPFMTNFDAPSRESLCTRRERSNTPLQALQLLNDVQHFEAARGFAERILTTGGSTPTERIDFAFRTLLARTPDSQETAVLAAALAQHLARFSKDEAAAKKVIAIGESKPNPKLPPGELAAYTLLANALLNLDETVTRN